MPVFDLSFIQKVAHKIVFKKTTLLVKLNYTKQALNKSMILVASVQPQKESETHQYLSDHSLWV